ncbi:MAG: hypothetical protein F6J97_24530 [Leptolyngbya sp. SIO4C1]|nr:hypothetical protein [Leptolyngbya sp. SIO4C1]
MICLVILGIWRTFETCKQGVNYLKHLHEIPCSQCIYFTGNYQLKCTVNPIGALTEEAIGCPDYEPTRKQTAIPSCRRAGWKNPPYYQVKALLKR